MCSTKPTKSINPSINRRNANSINHISKPVAGCTWQCPLSQRAPQGASCGIQCKRHCADLLREDKGRKNSRKEWMRAWWVVSGTHNVQKWKMMKKLWIRETPKRSETCDDKTESKTQWNTSHRTVPNPSETDCSHNQSTNLSVELYILLVTSSSSGGWAILESW